MKNVIVIQPEKEKLIQSDLIANTKKISSVSNFGDLVWDRSEYVERIHAKRAIIYWERLIEKFGSTHLPVIVSIMEFSYFLLFDPVEDDFQKDPKSIVNYVNYFGDFLEFLKHRNFYHITDLEQVHIHDFVQWLFQERKRRKKNNDSPQSCLKWIEHRIILLQLYYRYSKKVSQPLLVRPLHGESIFRHVGTRREKILENLTPVVPKSVWDRYLCAALDYVEYYSDDILFGQALIERIRADVLPIYIDIPTFDAANFNRDQTNPELRAISRKFANNPVTGQPWRENWDRIMDLLYDLRALHDACLVVLGGLSGMRETEISQILVNGFFASSSDEGLMQYRIASRLTKGQVDKMEEWEVNEPVYKACRILASLTSYARDGHKELLLQGWDRSPSSSLSINVDKKAKLGKGHGNRAILPIGAGACTRYLKRFASHLDDALDGQYRLPLVDDQPWNFIMRMLRRSLASRIAREPFGMIAGMLHYKHVRITTFAGYAGTDPEWVKELHEEEIAATDEFLDDICEGLLEGTLAGGKGEELLNVFSGLAGDLKKNAHQYFLESSRANLHVGLFNYCMFDPERALCLNSKAKGDAQPMLSACHPDRCANSCITPKHLPQWKVQESDARAMLAHSNISVPQRLALSHELESVVRVLDKLNNE